MFKPLGYLLASIRFLLIVVSISLFVIVGSLLFTFKIVGPKTGFLIRQAWCKLAIWIFGIKIIRTGNIDLTPGTLYVGNHRTLVDPVIALSLISNGYAVSKAEVADYPVIGYGAKLTGVIFVDRGNSESRKSAKNGIAAELAKKNSIILFPEGKTGTSKKTSDFKKGSFEAAAECGSPVVSFAMEFMNPKNDFWYIDHILSQYFKTFSSWRMTVRVHFFDPVVSTDGAFLLSECHTLINTKLVEFQQFWKQDHFVEEMESKIKIT